MKSKKTYELIIKGNPIRAVLQKYKDSRLAILDLKMNDKEFEKIEGKVVYLIPATNPDLVENIDKMYSMQKGLHFIATEVHFNYWNFTEEERVSGIEGSYDLFRKYVSILAGAYTTDGSGWLIRSEDGKKRIVSKVASEGNVLYEEPIPVSWSYLEYVSPKEYWDIVFYPIATFLCKAALPNYDVNRDHTTGEPIKEFLDIKRKTKGEEMSKAPYDKYITPTLNEFLLGKLNEPNERSKRSDK